MEEYLDLLVPLIKDEVVRQQVGTAARKRVEEYFSLQLMIERIEAIFTEAINISNSTSIISINSIVYEEMLLWIQEYLALDEFWHESQTLNQKIEEFNSWSKYLQKENKMFSSQSKAWKKAAQKAQTQLKESQVKLKQSEEKIILLESLIKQKESTKKLEAIIDNI